MDYAKWKYHDSAYLVGKSVDETGHEVQNWAVDMYKDLISAQVACVALVDGCKGVTGNHQSNRYSVRRTSTVKTIPDDEFSYLKPDNPCGRSFNQKLRKIH